MAVPVEAVGLAAGLSGQAVEVDRRAGKVESVEACCHYRVGVRVGQTFYDDGEGHLGSFPRGIGGADPIY